MSDLFDNRQCVGAVLAGGQSTRMGRDKTTLLMPDGRTMMQHVIDSLRQVCPKVVIVGPSDGQHRSVSDLRPRCGPLGGIESLLATGIATEYLICACDAPLMTADLLHMLLARDTSTAAVFHVRGRERFECLPLRIGAAALPVVEDHLNRNELALWKVIQSLDPHIIEIDESQAERLRNINTPAEFAALAHAVEVSDRR